MPIPDIPIPAPEGGITILTWFGILFLVIGLFILLGGIGVLGGNFPVTKGRLSVITGLLLGVPGVILVLPEIISHIREPLQFTDISISIDAVANQDIQTLLPDFPIGGQEFDGVQFYIPEQRNRLSTQCSNSLEFPTEFVVPLNYLSDVESIYLLINAGYTSGFEDKLIGVIEVYFLDGQSLKYNLILGHNIREWRLGALRDGSIVATTTDQNHKEIYIGKSPSGGPGVQDMLKLNIPKEYKNKQMTSILFRDITQDLWGSGNPCFRIVGITVRVSN